MKFLNVLGEEKMKISNKLTVFLFLHNAAKVCMILAPLILVAGLCAEKEVRAIEFNERR